MTPSDHQILRAVSAGLGARRATLLNPSSDVRRIFRRPRVLTHDAAHRPTKRVDVLVACNALMTSDDPAETLLSLQSCCRWLVLVEPVERQRSRDQQLGSDGDNNRVTAPGISGAADAFDLATAGTRLIAAREYDGGANEFGPARHLIALVAGDHAAPILRVDDYPSGVRPVASDLEPLHDVLRQIDDVGLPVHLGIVPAIIDGPMGEFLRSLNNLVPMAHGFDHCYPEKSQQLIQAGDPFNRNGTVSGFNEFEGQGAEAIALELRESRRILETATGRVVRGYIPPCNESDRATGIALVDAGYHFYFSEKKVPGCPLPITKSDFYGRSDEYDSARNDHVVSLHATWEVDVIEEGNTLALPAMLNHLSGLRVSSESEGRMLAKTFEIL